MLLVPKGLFFFWTMSLWSEIEMLYIRNFGSLERMGLVASKLAPFLLDGVCGQSPSTTNLRHGAAVG
jgi:hypothetical protein